MRRFATLFALLALTLAIFSAPALASDKLGIVLMHGLQGMPDRIIANLGMALDEAGYLVERPEMCWSKSRVYDKPYLDCLDEIDAAVAKLKQRGATAIVIAGQSLGGNAALGYGARHPGLKGIIGLAPAHAPERVTGRPEVAASLAKARAMIAAGKGGETDSFTDVNAALYQVRTTAAIYASFVGPDSAAMMPANAAKLTAPLLWVAGNADPTQLGPDYAFAKAPPNPLNRYVTVTASHLTTPDAAKDAVLAWLKELDR